MVPRRFFQILVFLLISVSGFCSSYALPFNEIGKSKTVRPMIELKLKEPARKNTFLNFQLIIKYSDKQLINADDMTTFRARLFDRSNHPRMVGTESVKLFMNHTGQHVLDFNGIHIDYSKRNFIDRKMSLNRLKTPVSNYSLKIV